MLGITHARYAALRVLLQSFAVQNAKNTTKKSTKASNMEKTFNEDVETVKTKS